MVSKTEHHLNTGCPIACALDLIGDHWTLLVIRDLMFVGKHEYKEFLASEEGISSNILSDRLKKLEEAEIIASTAHPGSKRRKLYYLTDRGKDLIYILLDISKWSDRHLEARVFIPEEKRPILDLPVEDVVATIMADLEAWESEWLK